jgi:hypothetical protein
MRRNAVALTVVLTLAPVAAAAQPAAAARDPRIAALVTSISESRLEQLLRTLVGFGTRNTLSDTSSPTRGIGAARQWILEELTRTSPRLQVSFDAHRLKKGAGNGRITRNVELRNVIAVLPGRSPRRIYVSGHYDSLNLGEQGQIAFNRGATAPPPAKLDPNVNAPGANDDGSGTVLVMELARVFAESGIDFDATLVFMAVAGEEQGLLGARAHARAMRAARVPVQGVFNNDIVGGAVGGSGVTDAETIRLYSEGPDDSPSRALATFTARTATRYVPGHTVRLLARRDRYSRGGDHTAWNLEGFAAIGFRESRENYARQHGPDDTIDGVSFAYLARNARVNAAAMAELALAPPPPAIGNARGVPMLDRRPSGYDARLRWNPSPGATGYRVVWRDAWTADWQHEAVVGNVTEWVLPNANIDDFVYGVSAIGPGGHESPVTAYVPPPPNY